MKKKCIKRCLFIVIGITLCMALYALDPVADEVTNVKAVFIYHFARYIQWPQNDDRYFQIAVVGSAPILDPLYQIAEKRKIDNHDIQVIYTEDVDATGHCHILFVPETSNRQLGKYVHQIEGKPVLIITEAEGALEEGSMINFRLINETVKFEINLKTMQTCGFYPSSELLKLAVRIVE